MLLVDSLRARFVLLAIAVVLAPLALLGYWLTDVARGSGEALLGARLDTAVVHAARDVGLQWTRQRSGLLYIAEHEQVRTWTARNGVPGDAPPVVELPDLVRQLPGAASDVRFAVIRDLAGRPLWTLSNNEGTATPRLAPPADTLHFAQAADTLHRGVPAATLPLAQPTWGSVTAHLPIYAPASFDPVGSLEVRLRGGSLVTGLPASAGGIAVIAMVDHATGASLVPLPFAADLLAHERFRWAGEEWLTRRRVLEEPALTLIAAAPLDLFTAPLQLTARRGLWALFSVSLAVLLATFWLSGRLTRSLEQLATAAAAVAAGDLDRRVHVRGAAEVARLNAAFNTMSENLRRTLHRLSERQAVAAVDEFAATLAHEVRNPLSAIRLNLQGLEERVADDAARAHVVQALRDIERLDVTVSGALQVARSGRVELRALDVSAPIAAALRSAAPAFERRQALLTPLRVSGAIPPVHGDAASLERLFLNLLLNAAQALDAGGSAQVTMKEAPDGVVVSVRDDGRGMDGETLRRVWEPFYSARAGGTGLGLPVARQIVAAHGGGIDVESAPGRGTTVHVTLRRCTDAVHDA